MSKEHLHPHIERLNLHEVNQSLLGVEENWQTIDDQLDAHKIGRKDTKFTEVVRNRMVSAYAVVDELLQAQIEPFAKKDLMELFMINNRVHYGTDISLIKEYQKAISANYDKFEVNVKPIAHWYKVHKKQGDHPLKLAAEVYVSILGYPQLFIEGNHRTGALIASWISMYYGFPPFVLSAENAISYFAPSSEIKKFANKSTWIGQAKLPKYKKSFREFWEKHIDPKYVLK